MLNLLANVFWYLLYFGVDIAMLLGSGWAYVKTTPYDEIAMIREGNTAAAVALGGAMLGYTSVLYMITTLSNSIFLLILWGVIALGVQLGAFEFLQHVVMHDHRGGLKARMEQGSLAHGVFLGMFSLAVGLLNAACLHP